MSRFVGNTIQDVQFVTSLQFKESRQSDNKQNITQLMGLNMYMFILNT